MKLGWLLILIWISKTWGHKNIECHWGKEYLCGDKCLPTTSKSKCQCGNDSIPLADASTYNCCHINSCFQDIDKNVYCHDGFKQSWRVPCHGLCQQSALYGWKTWSCASQDQCIKIIAMCRGMPLCHE